MPGSSDITFSEKPSHLLFLASPWPRLNTRTGGRSRLDPIVKAILSPDLSGDTGLSAEPLGVMPTIPLPQ